MADEALHALATSVKAVRTIAAELLHVPENGSILVLDVGVGHRPEGTRAAMAQVTAETDTARAAYLEEQIAKVEAQKAQAHAAQLLWQDVQLELFDFDDGDEGPRRGLFLKGVRANTCQTPPLASPTPPPTPPPKDL